jgi:hypothetical protein
MDLILLNNHSKFCGNKKDSVFSSIDIISNTVTIYTVYESRRHSYLPNLFFSITAEPSLFAEDILMAAGSSPPVDPKTVALEVQKGKSLEEVQRIFGIELKSQVQDLYVRGLRQLGEIPQFKMAKAKNRSAVKVVDMGYRRSIGQSGSITLTRSLLLEKLGFQKGDVFQILRQGDDLILRKVE